MRATTARTLCVLAVVLCGGCSGGSEPGGGEPGPWTTGLDSQPTLGLGGEGVVYVTSAGSSRYPPQVYALDEDTGEIVEQRTATGQPFDLWLAPDGRLWVAGDRHPDQAGGAGINVTDPRSLVVVEHVNLDGEPAFAVADVGDEVWVSTPTSVIAVDPATLEVGRTVVEGGPYYDLVATPDGERAVAVTDGRLDLLGPDGVERSLPVEADGSFSAFSGLTTPDLLWLRLPVDADSVVVSVPWTLDAPLSDSVVELDAAGGGLVLLADGSTLVAVDERLVEVQCVPAAGASTVTLAGDDASDEDGLPYAGALAALADGRVVLAGSARVTVAAPGCGDQVRPGAG